MKGLPMKGFTRPTRRDIVILGSLLVVIIVLTQVEYISSATSGLGVGEDAWRNLKGVFGKQSSPETSVGYPSPRLALAEQVPETKLLAHVPGWTIFDRAYLLNGTFYMVTSTPEDFPDRKFVISNGHEFFNGPGEEEARMPTDKDFQLISPEDAARIFKTDIASPIEGTSFFTSDPSQFITHYYHFAAEFFFGMWRTYSSLDPNITPEGHTSLPPPRRFVFPHVSCERWRDPANMNQFVLRGAFPSVSMEFEEDWVDRASLGKLFVFDRVVIADRSAACKGEINARTLRTASEAFALPGSEQYWWHPIRNNIVQFAGLAPEWLGPDPGTLADRQKLVITYISRQGWGRRMLRPGDHDKLVSELYKLKETYGYEVNVANMEKYARSEQITLAGRTTIMMGVHGNGLTALLWMRPTARSTVIEFFTPGGVAFDYQWTAGVIGIRHYGTWNDKAFAKPNVPRYQHYPDSFHSNDIPVDGELVARIAQRRLSLTPDDEDDLVTTFDE